MCISGYIVALSAEISVNGFHAVLDSGANRFLRAAGFQQFFRIHCSNRVEILLLELALEQKAENVCPD
jgi:hypothetical protein